MKRPLITRIRWAIGGGMAIMGLGTAIADASLPKGLQLPSTRVIYPSDADKGLPFTVKNTTDAPFLIQSWVTSWQGSQATLGGPFIVTPPLSRLAAGEALTLRLRYVQKNLPSDRESLLGFHVKAIPSQAEPAASTTATGQQIQMAFALQYNLKLFYRPEALPAYDAAQVADALQFTKDGSSLQVTNPSAFYVTFDTLTFAGETVARDALFDMVPPFGQQTYPLSTHRQAGTVTWRVITDWGSRTALQSRTLTSSVSTDKKG